MKNIINREQPFQVLATNFSIGPSSSGYELEISADGVNYTSLFTVGANVTRLVTSVANGSYYRLAGNTDEDVVVNWRTQCNDGGQGGGGGQYILPPATEQTLGGIKVGDGLSITNDGTLSADGGADPEAIQEAIDANNELLENGDIVVGMAKQLYSPNGTTSDGTFDYRTTAGDADVSSGPANLMKVMGNATYPQVEYNDSAVLMREGSEVEGFDADFAWGEVGGWSAVNQSVYNVIETIKMRVAATTGVTYVFTYRQIGSYSYYEPQVSVNSSNNLNLSPDSNWTEVVAGREYIYRNAVNIKYDGHYIISEYIEGYNFNANSVLVGGYPTNFEVYVGMNIPNDIPYGESTYTYDGSDWTPSLPEAMTAMTLNSETYSPESGDEIVINRSFSKSGSASYPQPHSFVALGLNSFTKDGSPINLIAAENYRIGYVSIEEDEKSLYQDNDYNIYAIKAVTGLSNGYVVYHKSGSSISIAGVADKDIENLDICYSATTHTSTYDVVFPTAEFPYIVFSVRKDEDDTICVHPRWSGYMDEEYEDYSESVLDIHTFNAVCPLVSVGTTKNVWDFENGKLIKNIDVIDYSADEIDALINDGKTLGTDFDFDENYIYEVSSNPVETNITFDNSYDANDFSVEYFTNANDSDLSAEAAGAETYYMQNLVDKLRRMENNFIHLNSLDTAGEEGKTYEYNGRLFKWVNGAGVWGEWLSGWDNSGYPESNGYTSIIFKYSEMPVGELCRVYDFNNLRTYLVYDGEKITSYTDSTHTAVYTAVTIGCKDVNMSNQTNDNYKVLLTWTDGKLIFKTGPYASLRSRANTALTGPHYEALDMSVAASNDAGVGDMGLPIWNKEGIVIGKKVGYNNRTIYFNTTGYNNNKNFLAGANWNGPDRIWVPTQGGTQGQVLTSNGDSAEPVWETMIKAQKITSDAYEALAVKDPNTLYLIDDEV